MKRFRAGTIVRWKHNGGNAYGIVLGLKRVNYSVRSVAGAGKSTGAKWRINPSLLTAVPPSKQPDEVVSAIAQLALTGKVVKPDAT